MSILYHERPGVYSDVDSANVYSTAGRGKIAALIGISAAAAGVYTVTDCASGLAALGGGTQLGKLLRLCYENGAGTVVCIPVSADTVEAYTAALALLTSEAQASYLCVGSAREDVQTLVRDKVAALSADRGECIGLCGMEEPTVAHLTTRAAALNSERMVLLGPDVYLPGSDAAAGGCYAAAALCGALCAQTDPALPLTGQSLEGLTGVTARYSDTQIDALVRGGVTVVENDGGAVRVLRAITTRTTTAGAADATWRELSTVLIVDDVIPAVRTMLRARFPRAKNNAATRGAIRSQVVVVLEDRLGREVIDGYDNVRTYADTSDATVCVVEFGFTVAHGLSRIHLFAHLSV